MSLVPLTFELLRRPYARAPLAELSASAIHEAPLSHGTLLHLLLASPLLAPELDDALSGASSSRAASDSPLAQLLAQEAELNHMLHAALDDETMLSALGLRLLQLQGWHAPSFPARASPLLTDDDDGDEHDEYECELLAHEVLRCRSGHAWVIHYRYGTPLSPNEQPLVAQHIELLEHEHDAAQEEEQESDVLDFSSRSTSLEPSEMPEQRSSDSSSARRSASPAPRPHGATPGAEETPKRIKVHDTRSGR